MALPLPVFEMDPDAYDVEGSEEDEDLVVAQIDGQASAEFLGEPPRKRPKLDADSLESPDQTIDTTSVLQQSSPLGQPRQRPRAKRNFRNIHIGRWEIEPGHYSPYPLPDEDDAVYTAFQRITPPPSATNGRHGRSRKSGSTIESEDFAPGASILWVCDRCFKYTKNAASHELHAKTCQSTHPPGRKVYQKGALTIWEVDGALSKLFCQNLSLFGKLFIDVKEIYFDVEPFMFYLLTDGDPRRDHVLGFFSKEKISYDNNNLACIITFPPYQKRGYGMLMIEFSYELSRRDGVFGSPERPLSESGVRTYLAFWISMLVRHLRSAFKVHGSPTRSANVSRKWKNTKGWDGELPLTRARAGALQNGTHPEDPFAGKRVINGIDVSVKMTLQDLAQATYIRPEDIAMALNECGLLKRRRTMGMDSHPEIIICQRDLERVAEAYHVKPQFLHPDHVML